MAVKGRHWVALWLLGFLAVAWVVVARQTAALRMARDLTATRAQRAALVYPGFFSATPWAQRRTFSYV